MKMAASLPMRPFYLTRLSSHTACNAGALVVTADRPVKADQHFRDDRAAEAVVHRDLPLMVSPTKPVIHPELDRVDALFDIYKGAHSVKALVLHSREVHGLWAEEVVVVFGKGRPIRREGPFDAAGPRLHR
jgi:hypothetical protein